MGDSELAKLSDALERIAAAIEANPAPIIGQKIVAVGGAEGSTVIGMKIVAKGDGSGGTVIGNRVTVTNAGGRNADEAQMIKELRDAAAAVRGGTAPKSWIMGLLQRTGGFVGKAISAATVAGAEELAKNALT